MRIKQLQYHNKALDWRLETTHFSNLTLLVGISGVGKTQILDAIWRVKSIADGNPANGVKWDIVFSASNGDEFCWKGEYEVKTSPEENGILWRDEEDSSNKPKIENEELIRNGEIVVQRDASDIYLRGNKTPKLSPFESVIDILNQEEDVAPAYDSFTR